MGGARGTYWGEERGVLGRGEGRIGDRRGAYWGQERGVQGFVEET